MAKQEMYLRDGLHLSGKGAAVFCRWIETSSWVTLFKQMDGVGQRSLKAHQRIVVPM